MHMRNTEEDFLTKNGIRLSFDQLGDKY